MWDFDFVTVEMIRVSVTPEIWKKVIKVNKNTIMNVMELKKKIGLGIFLNS